MACSPGTQLLPLLLLPALLIILLLTAIFVSVLLLPLRIFVRYLRENREDELVLRIKVLFFELRLEFSKRGSAEGALTGYLRAGPLRIAAPSLQKMACRMSWPGDMRHLKKPLSLMKLRRRSGSLLKRITWSRFELEICWGCNDPALTGLAAGGGWALGGMAAGLFQKYFSVTSRPQFRLRPLFNPAELQLRLEGEAVTTLYSCLKLWRRVKK